MISARLRFENVIKEDLSDEKCRVSVLCSHAEKMYRASREGLSHGDAPLGLAASATLEIVEEFAQHQLHCSLEEYERTTALGRELIVLLVRLEHNGSRVQLFGSCRIKPEEPDYLAGSVRATLDATNRYVELVRKQVF